MKIRRFYGKNVRTALRDVTDAFGEDAAILSNNKVPGGIEIIAALDYDASLMPSKESEIETHPGSGAEQLDAGNLHGSDSSNRSDSNPFHSHQVSAGLSRLLDNAANKQQNQSASNIDNSSNFSNGQQPVDGKRSFSKSSQKLENEVNRSSYQPVAEQETQNQANTQAGFNLHSDFGAQADNTRNQNSAPSNAPLTDHLANSASFADMVKANRVEWSLDPSLQAMREELGLMRNMMSEQLQGLGWHHFAEKNPVTAMLMRRLSQLGLNAKAVHQIIASVNYQQNSDAECLWQQTLALLAKSIPVVDDTLLSHGGVFALMGPTGVGKTTTIAKLAARFIIKHGKESVALITTDNYRISAFEQLATFGKILQLPVAKVSDKQSLPDLLKKFSDKKLVLIDTAGVSANDPAIFQQFNDLMGAGSSIRRLLLMSAASQGAVISQSLTLFAKYQPQGVIITKLDEAACLGEVISILLNRHLPVFYTTDGQRIPEDIRVARSHHLVSKAVWLSNKFQRDVDEWSLAKNIDGVKTA